MSHVETVETHFLPAAFLPLALIESSLKDSVEREGMVASFVTHFITISISLQPIMVANGCSSVVEHWWLKTKRLGFDLWQVFSYIVASLTQTGPHDLVSGNLDSDVGMRLWKTAYEYITTGMCMRRSHTGPLVGNCVMLSVSLADK